MNLKNRRKKINKFEKPFSESPSTPDAISCQSRYKKLYSKKNPASIDFFFMEINSILTPKSLEIPPKSLEIPPKTPKIVEGIR